MELPRLPLLLVGAALMTGCPLPGQSSNQGSTQNGGKPAPEGCHYSGGGKGPPILVCDQPKTGASEAE